MHPAPTAEEQVAFLGKVERLLAEGQFTATYKYALLVSLADLAVEHGHDDGRELDLPVRDIGERFLEIYWRQALPFGTGVADGEAMTLLQNKGRQAAIISQIRAMQRRHSTLAAARRDSGWSRAVSTAARLVTTMPLWRLQVIGREPQEFLYASGTRADHIRLKAGVAANLRRFHGLILRLAQSEWLRFVQETNQSLLGAHSDLASFLFGADRRGLSRLREGLKDLQHGRCFYCHKAVRDAGAVDHFIAWSRYPRDLTHNFVLAHGTCNGDKRDFLADERHLERWVERNMRDEAALGDIGSFAGITTDWGACRQVAQWAYAQAQILDAQVWSSQGALAKLHGEWQNLLLGLAHASAQGGPSGAHNCP